MAAPTKAPSARDGQPIGRPMGRCLTVNPARRKSRRRATALLGLTFDEDRERVPPPSVTRKSTEADVTRAVAAADQMWRWHRAGWRSRVIAHKLRLPKSAVLHVLGRDADQRRPPQGRRP